jgi:glycosyltransferase involved in cell wall biosynthesis
MKRIIFHHPVAVDGESSGSQIRPLKMLEAFRAIGYEVDEVMGYIKDRKKAIKKIKQNIGNGVKYDFLYSESSTMPTALTEPHHLPIAPFFDFNFFKFCKNNEIKIGLFYRDIYWVFNEYKESLSYLKYKLANYFYRFDLKMYNRYIDILYLPSLKMNNYLPIEFKKEVRALPPAIELKKIEHKSSKSIEFIYVGGISSLYDLKLFSSVVYDYKDMKFHLCIRRNEWENIQDDYDKFNPKVYHLLGEALSKVYQKSNIAIYFIKPNKLWEFAMGVKLFEYISYKKPIIAVKNTAVGNFIEKNNIGWVINYKEEELKELLIKLKKEPILIEEKIKNIEKIIPYNTWEARAKQVAKELR